MKKIGKSGPVTHLSLRHPQGPAYEAEVFRRSWLMDLGKRKLCNLHQPQRPDFHLFMWCLRGTGQHLVDFVTCPCAPGTLVHIRPGQIHQWKPQDDFDAICVVFREGFLPANPPNIGNWPPYLNLSEALLASVEKMFQLMLETWEKEADLTWAGPVLQHLVQALLGLIARGIPGEQSEMIGEHAQFIVQRFTKVVDGRFTKARDVGSYARNLGVSSRTLDRDCILVLRRTAKQLINDRVALEAKRLLTHTPLAVAEIATEVGFTEPTNFVKFFRREVKCTPGAFRREQVQSSSRGVLKTGKSSVRTEPKRETGSGHPGARNRAVGVG